MSIRKMLVSEVEDSMRKQGGSADLYPALDLYSGARWPNVRQVYIDLAAWMILFVEIGDKHAAETQAQDSGGDSKSEIQGPRC